MDRHNSTRPISIRTNDIVGVIDDAHLDRSRRNGHVIGFHSRRHGSNEHRSEYVCYDSGVHVKVLFFGQLEKVITGHAEDSLELAEGGSLEMDFRPRQPLPRMQELRSSHSVAIACNQHFAEASTPVLDGDEIEFLPPVSGDRRPRTYFEVATRSTRHWCGTACLRPKTGRWWCSRASSGTRSLRLRDEVPRL